MNETITLEEGESMDTEHRNHLHNDTGDPHSKQEKDEANEHHKPKIGDGGDRETEHHKPDTRDGEYLIKLTNEEPEAAESSCPVQEEPIKEAPIEAEAPPEDTVPAQDTVPTEEPTVKATEESPPLVDDELDEEIPVEAELLAEEDEENKQHTPGTGEDENERAESGEGNEEIEESEPHRPDTRNEEIENEPRKPNTINGEDLNGHHELDARDGENGPGLGPAHEEPSHGRPVLVATARDILQVPMDEVQDLIQPTLLDTRTDASSSESSIKTSAKRRWIDRLTIALWLLSVITIFCLTLFVSQEITWQDPSSLLTAAPIPFSQNALNIIENLLARLGISIPRGLTLTQAKSIDFTVGAVIAPSLIGFANIIWFGLGKRLSHPYKLPVGDDSQSILATATTGSYDFNGLFRAISSFKLRSITFAILLLASAVAGTMMANVLAYKAVFPSPRLMLQTTRHVGTEEQIMYMMMYIPFLLFLGLASMCVASGAALVLALDARRSKSASKSQSLLPISARDDVVALVGATSGRWFWKSKTAKKVRVQQLDRDDVEARLIAALPESSGTSSATQEARPVIATPFWKFSRNNVDTILDPVAPDSSRSASVAHKSRPVAATLPWKFFRDDVEAILDLEAPESSRVTSTAQEPHPVAASSSWKFFSFRDNSFPSFSQTKSIHLSLSEADDNDLEAQPLLDTSAPEVNIDARSERRTAKSSSNSSSRPWYFDNLWSSRKSRRVNTQPSSTAPKVNVPMRVETQTAESSSNSSSTPWSFGYPRFSHNPNTASTEPSSTALEVNHHLKAHTQTAQSSSNSSSKPWNFGNSWFSRSPKTVSTKPSSTALEVNHHLRAETQTAESSSNSSSKTWNFGNSWFSRSPRTASTEPSSTALEVNPNLRAETQTAESSSNSSSRPGNLENSWFSRSPKTASTKPSRTSPEYVEASRTRFTAQPSVDEAHLRPAVRSKNSITWALPFVKMPSIPLNFSSRFTSQSPSIAPVKAASRLDRSWDLERGDSRIFANPRATALVEGWNGY